MKTLNNNIIESYCSYEVSKLLKKKGFRVPCDTGYYVNGKTRIDMPTHAIAQEWLRVNFNIWIDIGWKPVDHNFGNGKSTEVKWWYMISEQIGNAEETLESVNDFNSPQEATEAALLYILKEII